MDESTMRDLRAVAAEIVRSLHANGFPAESAVTRNLLCLAEEAGEVVGAYRRLSGQARRRGTLVELGAELADVVLAAHVMAHEVGITLTTALWPLASSRFTTERWVLVLFSWTARLLTGDEGFGKSELDAVVLSALMVAQSAGIDMTEALHAKVKIIFSRGWHETGTGA